jgi:hypothetical protein
LMLLLNNSTYGKRYIGMPLWWEMESIRVLK